MLPRCRGGEGWEPIGTDSAYFTGTFDGNRHVISGLSINRVAFNQGLFGAIGEDGTVMDLGVLGSITAFSNLGGLAGTNLGSIGNSYASVIVAGAEKTGGLVGLDGSNASIIGSYATGNVSGGRNSAGGLAGSNYGIINASYATGTISGTAGYRYVGGLVGHNNAGTINDCHADGNVNGGGNSSPFIGGLVGYSSNGVITSSYAEGAVNGGAECPDLGGLVGGTFNGTISKCYATGTVSSASVSGSSEAGGLVGWNMTGDIYDCYATGAVGGLLGISNTGGTISRCYATGAVSGNSVRGGLAGLDGGSEFTHCYYDYQTTGQSDTAKGIPRSTAQMKVRDSLGITYAGWDFTGNTADGTDDIWSIDATQVINNGYPYLADNPPVE
jgi:hypothetical protein